MLALGLEQTRRGGNGIGGAQKRATVAWQAPSPGSPLANEQCVNIRQKISQWEGRSHPDAGVKSHPPVVSRTLSADLLGNGFCGNATSQGPQGRACLSKAKSLGLDFREARATAKPNAGSRKSEPLGNYSRDISTSTPEKKLVVPSLPSSPTADIQPLLPPGKQINMAGVISKPGPSLTDDSDDNMPSGNFYTSRGFWRRLEGDKLLWEKGLESSGASQPPPKPQRTFQYMTSSNPSAHLVQWDPGSPGSLLHGKRSGTARPPSFTPPACTMAQTNGLTRHKKNRKSFEYEDAPRLTVQRSTLGGSDAGSVLSHAYSDDNIYEDIVCDVTRDNPYEDVKLSPMCLPVSRPRPRTISQRQSPHAPKLPPKPHTLRSCAGKSHQALSPSGAGRADSPGPAAPRRPSTPKAHKPPHYVSKIETIFDAKRGKKRVKNQGGVVRETEETSGTESDPEDSAKGSRRAVYVQSTLRRRPGYRTLERDLIQLQQQQLFQLFVVVSLRKGSPGNTYSPEITQQFPKIFEKSSRHSREAEDRLKAIPKFCFPDSQDWRPSADMPSETFSFVLTGEDGSRWFCYCRKILPSGKGKRLPEVHCIVSKLGCFNLFAKILEEVERRREICPVLVHPFMRAVMEAPFPAPGRTITVKSFLPGTGNEVLTLCRPVDSRLEHVDFESLLQCLGVGKLLQVFGSLLLERRVIFIADKLSVLSRCSHAVLALLYPFTWQHTFVPVLPASMLDISCSPTPFLLGALAPCLPELLDLPIEEVLIVDLCTDRFVVQLGDEDCILPSKLQAALQQILEDREVLLKQEDEDSSGGCRAELSSLLSEAFVRFFVELVGHYPLHMAEAAAGAAGARELQRDAFRKSHPSRGVRQFLQLFMDTQMFSGFIQDKELRKGDGKGLFEARAAEYMESYSETETSGVNKFLKGLGSRIKFLQMK